MKLEVGMYVRYISGFHHNKSDKPIVLIGKLLRVDDYINLDTFFGGGVYPTKEFEKFIKGEPSHNIIDLIQSKDLIVDTKNNLYVVDRVEGDYVFTTSKNEYGLIITLVDYQIKSIVTKEQFAAMQYEVV